MKRWNGSAYVDLTTAKRWDGTAYVDLTLAKRWDGSAWIDIALPGGGGGDLSATSTSSVVSGDVMEYCPGCPLFTQVCSGSVTVTATGGSGAGPTIAWTQITGTGGTVISDASAFTVSWCASVGRNQSKSSTWRATVVRGSETVTLDVEVTLTYNTDL